MVARINFGYSIRRSFFYNENKVKEGAAQLLLAENFPLSTAHTTEKFRLHYLLNQAALNDNVRLNSMHISLNFDPSEKDITDKKLQQIAQDYMEGIGFGKQPFLVYRHNDAAHPHLHIVSIKVDEKGQRIDTNYIAERLSEPTRIALEKKYHLVKANDHALAEADRISPISAIVATYGKSQVKRAITNVLDRVYKGYHFASLAEFNAALRQFHVCADPGEEGSRTKNYKGLYYRILDDNGQKVGVPIKASSIHSKPTLKNLEALFVIAKEARIKYRSKLTNSINLLLLQRDVKTLEDFIQKMQQEGTYTVLRESSDGRLFGLTYVDNRTKCVFNGSELGKAYTAKGILDRLQQNQESAQITTHLKTSPSSTTQQGVQDSSTSTFSFPIIRSTESEDVPSYSASQSLLELLLRPEFGHQGLSPYERKKRKKRKQKKY